VLFYHLYVGDIDVLYLDMLYAACKELFDDDSMDFLPDEAQALSLSPLGEEGFSTSHVSRADETAFEEMV
jgi:hypothetical protein